MGEYIKKNNLTLGRRNVIVFTVAKKLKLVIGYSKYHTIESLAGGVASW